MSTFWGLVNKIFLERGKIMPKKNPFILCFASCWSIQPGLAYAVLKPCISGNWALLNPDLLMVYYPGHRLSKLLPAVVRSPFGPCSGRWHLQLPLRGGGSASFTLCEPLGVELTKEPGCVGRLAPISSPGELKRKKILFKSMSAL